MQGGTITTHTTSIAKNKPFLPAPVTFPPLFPALIVSRRSGLTIFLPLILLVVFRSTPLGGILVTRHEDVRMDGATIRFVYAAENTTENKQLFFAQPASQRNFLANEVANEDNDIHVSKHVQ